MTNSVKLKKVKKPKNYSLVLHAIKQLNLTLAIIFILAIVCLLNYECLWFINPWPNDFTTGLNKIIVQVFYAYITGLIFYFIVELLPKQKVKVSILRIVCNNAFIMDARCKILTNEICRSAGKKIGDVVTLDEFSKCCESLNIHSTNINIRFSPTMNLKSFVLNICNEVNVNAVGLLQHADLLDEKWIHRIVNVIDEIRYIERDIDLNTSRSTLNLVAYRLWNLQIDSKLLHKLSNELYIKNQKVHRQQNRSTFANPANLTFVVSDH